MMRFILKNSEKGVRIGELEFHMTINFGMSDEWVEKYLKKWVGFGVVLQSGNKFKIDEKKWGQVQRARDLEASSLEG